MYIPPKFILKPESAKPQKRKKHGFGLLRKRASKKRENTSLRQPWAPVSSRRGDIPDQSWLHKEPKTRLAAAFRKRSVATASLLLAGLLVLGAVLYKDADQPGQPMEAAAHDLKQLWDWSDVLLANGAAGSDWSLRLDASVSMDTLAVGDYSAAGESSDNAKQVRGDNTGAASNDNDKAASSGEAGHIAGSGSSEDGFTQAMGGQTVSEQNVFGRATPAVQKLAGLWLGKDGRSLQPTVISNEGRSVTGAYPLYEGATLSIHETGLEGEKVRLILLLERPANIGEAQALTFFQAAASSLAKSIGKHGEIVHTSMKVTGYTAEPDAAALLKRLALADKLEVYEQDGTLSEALFSGKLKTKQSLDDKQAVNLQIAEHKHTETGITEVTVGIPLISGEFGRSAPETASVLGK